MERKKPPLKTLFFKVECETLPAQLLDPAGGLFRRAAFRGVGRKDEGEGRSGYQSDLLHINNLRWYLPSPRMKSS
jgi:hypothetical protein